MPPHAKRLELTGKEQDVVPVVTESDKFIDFLGGRFEFAASFPIGSDTTVLIRNQMAPGRIVPLHSHVDPEGLYVVSGTLGMWLDVPEPGWRPVEAGRSILISDGLRHSLRNSGDTPLELIMAVNGRLAQFSREAGTRVERDSAFQPPTREAVGQVMQAAARFGYWIATPPEAEKIIGASGVTNSYSHSSKP